MYLEIYLYPVKEAKLEDFLRINKAAESIYLSYGALESETYFAKSVEAQYGCLGFDSAIELEDDEVLMMEINRYRDKTHQVEVLSQVDIDPKIDTLYNEMIQVIDIGRTVRGEFGA